MRWPVAAEPSTATVARGSGREVHVRRKAVQVAHKPQGCVDQEVMSGRAEGGAEGGAKWKKVELLSPARGGGSLVTRRRLAGDAGILNPPPHW